jgi:hypothetical protein
MRINIVTNGSGRVGQQKKILRTEPSWIELKKKLRTGIE